MKNKKLILTISIDDVHPEKGWMIIGDKTEKWLNLLHAEFGVKFNLFIPSCYHHKYPISQYKSWINELNSDPKFSCEAHGHFHMTSDPQRFGECEFAELDTWRKCHDRMVSCSEEWNKCDVVPVGIRPPGWLVHPAFNSWFNGCRYHWFTYKYIAVHYDHNNGLVWNREPFIQEDLIVNENKIMTFFGHDGIQQEHIEIHNISPDGETGMIMFQSHIAGKHNHNVWNEENYEQLRISLTHLFENFDVTPKTLKEC